MATSLKELGAHLDAALGKGDLDAVAEARRKIAAAFPDTEAGSEAAYKLGLDALYRRRDLEGAAEQMRAAVKVKGPFAVLARSALGLILLRQGKAQQAIFELRKVAGTTPPTLLSATGHGLLVYALRETKQLKEAERARTEHKKALQKVAEGKVADESALAHFMLGMEYKFDGERDLAKRHLQTAVASPLLPPLERGQAEKALTEV
ncbi:hypothetical protein L6R52_12340 [Myxococcota bacterium]|nr:hypothetical protein [Myxococcota bacterium]